MNLNPYSVYIKIGAAAVVAALLVGGGYHFGGLANKVKLEEVLAAQAQTTANAVLAERASADAQRERDHNTELTHAKQIIHIDSAPDITTPIMLCGSDEVRVGALPSAEGKADSVGADTEGGRSVEMDRGRARRAHIEEVKKRLERIMADYRQEDSEWDKK